MPCSMAPPKRSIHYKIKMPAMKYHSLIFDLDGTLTDPVVGIVRCMNYALTMFDHPPRAEHEITPYIGPPLEIALQELSGSDDESYIKRLMATYRERYSEFGYAENTVYDGIYEMLESFREQEIPMGVCTSKFGKYAVKILEEFNLIEFFQFVSGGDYNVRKQDQLAELLQSKTIQTDSLMIGDREIDLSAARNNGLAGAGVLWGYGSEQELRAENPAFLFKSPDELIRDLSVG